MPFKGVPTWARVLLGLYVLAFVEGFVVHLVQIVEAGSHVYAGTSGLVRAFFVALLVLDPVVAFALVRRPRLGVALAALLMSLDVATNWYVNWDAVSADPGRLAVPFGVTPITMFGLFVAVTARPLRRQFARSSVKHGRRAAGLLM